jgi:ribosomal protein S18 acetylase RimI-like enzyme
VAEDPRLAGVITRAFWDDPILTWLIPNEPNGRARMEAFFRAELYTAHRRGTVLTTPERDGASLWYPPDQWRTPPSHIARQAPSLVWALGRRVPAGLKLLTKMEHLHPTEPHWYLSVIGTDPARQGRGVGAALIEAITDRCDAEGLPAYLESSKERNISYYARFGFEVTDELSVAGSPPLWPMWRPAP